MEIGDPVEEGQVLLAVAESELFSRHYALGLGKLIPEAVNERVRYSSVDEWSADDRHVLIEAACELRAPRLAPLLHLGVKWFQVWLRLADLPTLAVPATPEFRRLAPDLRLGSLVAAIEKGDDTHDAAFSGEFRRLKRDFRASQIRGRPSMVAPGRDGPFTIFEGLIRLAVILALTPTPRAPPEPLAAYLGETDRLAELGWVGAGATDPRLIPERGLGTGGS